MSLPQEPQTARLIAGLLFREPNIQQQTLKALTERFGPFDFLSEPKPFTFTDYYEKEMGGSIYRQTGSFEQLVPPDSLPDIKLFTNRLERDFSEENRRMVNIDPGLLSEERLVLATGKNYIHRVYLRNGIFADLTLIYEQGAYRPLTWTYPDYREPDLLHFLGILRQKLIFQRTSRLPRKV
ncbi:MAG: DUF4416 family protein [Desulforhabdus sp.]|jgi:hypothetical protein|nr:DUF4416 family protein [Desulforhabdus sp.]